MTLNNKNSELHHNIQQYTDKTNFKVNRLKTAINDVIEERKYQFRETAPLEDYSYS